MEKLLKEAIRVLLGENSIESKIKELPPNNDPKFKFYRKNPIKQVPFLQLSDEIKSTYLGKKWEIKIVDVSKLVSAQSWVDPERLSRYSNLTTRQSDNDLPTAVDRGNGVFRIIDGNHRAVISLLKGERKIKVRVLGTEKN